MGLWRKKEDKKKFEYSDDTKELFAERDAFYAEMRKKMGGDSSNPEVANQANSDKSIPKSENLDDLLGDSDDFNPYVDEGKTESDTIQSVPPLSSPPSKVSGYVCTSCDKGFQEKWGKCPSCGGKMKRARSQAPSEPVQAPKQPEQFTPSTLATDMDEGDPLDDLLGDFSASDSSASSSEDEPSDADSGVRMVDDDDLSTNFGKSVSSHTKRRVRKVKKVKRPRKSP